MENENIFSEEPVQDAGAGTEIASNMPDQDFAVEPTAPIGKNGVTILEGTGGTSMNDAGSIKRASFAPLQPSPVSGEQGSMDLIMDISLDLSVELGHTSIPVRDVLQLGPGSILELDKLAGEAVDILVNGKLIAKGEVVVVDENFGIRVIEIASRTERLTGLA